MSSYPRNLTPFTFDPSVDFSNLEEQVGGLPLIEPGALEVGRVGFVPPSGVDGDPLVVRVDRYLAFAVGIKEKVIPASVIHERLKAKIQELGKQGYVVGGKRRRELKREIIDVLLAQAFCKLTVVRGWIDKRGWVFFDTSSVKNAEVCLSRLREAMGSFPAVPVQAASRILFGAWVRAGEPPARFGFGDSCVLAIESTRWTGKGVDLCGEEVREHLKAGAQFDRIGLSFDDRLVFSLDSQCVVRQLACVEEMSEPADEEGDRGFEADVLRVAADASGLFTEIVRALQIELAEAA